MKTMNYSYQQDTNLNTGNLISYDLADDCFSSRYCNTESNGTTAFPQFFTADDFCGSFL